MIFDDTDLVFSEAGVVVDDAGTDPSDIEGESDAGADRSPSDGTGDSRDLGERDGLEGSEDGAEDGSVDPEADGHDTTDTDEADVEGDRHDLADLPDASDGSDLADGSDIADLVADTRDVTADVVDTDAQDLLDALDADTGDAGDSGTGDPTTRCLGRVVQTHDEANDVWLTSSVCDESERCVEGDCESLPAQLGLSCGGPGDCTHPELDCYSDHCLFRVPVDEGEPCLDDLGCVDDLTCSPSGFCSPVGFVYIPPGAFWMGSPEDEAERRADREQRRLVTLTNGYFMSEAEVTLTQWEEVMDTTHSNKACGSDGGTGCPVVNVSWAETLGYSNALSGEILDPCYDAVDCNDAPCDVTVTADSGSPYHCVGFRLPTEAEWEYAYRAGSTGPYYRESPSEGEFPDAIGWYGFNSGGVDWDQECSWLDPEGELPKTPRCAPHAVKAKDPNAYGLYDMAGNAEEWVWDVFEADVTLLGTHDPVGASDGATRVRRGGSWSSKKEICRAASREPLPPSTALDDLGFRVVRTVFP